ncbi:MAG TPA: hypothetical protein VJ694_00890 [Patescibacteria group bacterium]|nr:hypothetical protein [Patescibacteria group bacterium]
MDRPYDSLEGIRTYVSTLKGLHALREDRRQAAARYEFQSGYVALGRYVLTEDGRFGELTGVAAELGESSPDAVPFARFEGDGKRAFGAAWRMSYRTPASLAPPRLSCPECGRGWDLRDAHRCAEIRDVRQVWLDEFVGMTFADLQDAFRAERMNARWDLLSPVPRLRGGDVVEEGDEATFLVTAWMHPDCRVKRCRRDALWWAEDFLARAGLPDADPEPYDPQVRYLEGTFWFRLETPHGPVRFGSKPPGFVIDWKETGKALPDLFRDPHWLEPPKEHGPFHVRPSDEKYLLRHFVKLRAALGF